MYFIFRDYIIDPLDPGFEVQFVLLIIRLVPLFIITHEIFKSLPIILIGGLAIVHIVIEYIVQIGKTRKINDFISCHNLICVYYSFVGTLAEIGVGIFLLFSMLLLVSLNFGTLRGFGIVPMPLYILFPGILCVWSRLVVHVFNLAIKLYEQMLNNIAKSKKRVNIFQPNRKYFRKKLRSLRPLVVHFRVKEFNLFKIQKSSRTSYYDAVLNNTITLLLSVPEELLKA